MWLIVVAITFVVLTLAAILWQRRRLVRYRLMIWDVTEENISLAEECRRNCEVIEEYRQSLDRLAEEGSHRNMADDRLLNLVDYNLKILSCSLESLGDLVPVLIQDLTGFRSRAVVMQGEKIVFRIDDKFESLYREEAQSSWIELDGEPSDKRKLELAAVLAELESHVHRLHEMTTDGLTGLYSRKRFDNDLKSEIIRSRRFSHPLSIVLFDLDHFKAINDVFGHPMGDMALRHVASILEHHHRRHEIVARTGGDEFGVILPETTARQAAKVAEKVRKEVAKRPIQKPETGERVSLTLCVGIASLTSSNGDNLYDLADQALYVSKRRGRNCITIKAPCKGEKGA